MQFRIEDVQFVQIVSYHDSDRAHAPTRLHNQGKMQAAVSN